MLVIGLTGGIATGKSTVSSLLSSHGIPVIDADTLAREAVSPGTRGLARVVAEFGPEVLRADGALDRARLGAVVFTDAEKRRRLNDIVHPAVRRGMMWGVLKCWLTGKRVCVLDVPLLIETGMARWMGAVVVVYCSRAVQLVRLRRRDGSTHEAASSRLDSQLPISLKLKYADMVVDNSGSLKDVEGQVLALVQRLEKNAGWIWWLEWVVPPIGLFSAVITLAWRAWRRA